MRNNSARISTIAALAFVLTFLSGASRALAADPAPKLEIVTPTTGTVFQSGQTIQLTVLTTHALAARRPGIAVLGDGGLGGAVLHRRRAFASPLGTPLPRKGPPVFGGSIVIPANLKPGQYKLTAVARGLRDKLVASAPVYVQIELPPNALLSLTPPPPPMVFEAIGEQLPLRIVGNTSGGLVNLTGSQNLALTASDPSIVSVGPNAMVTAVAPGKTSLLATLSGGPSMSVPIEVLPPALTPSATSIDFGAQTIATESATQILTITNTLSYAINYLSITSSPEFYPVVDNCARGGIFTPGWSCTIILTFRPLGVGQRTGVIEIANNAVIAPTRIYFSGIGNTTPGVQAQVVPKQLFFEVANSKRGQTRQLRIRNLGTAVLHGYVPGGAGPYGVTGGTAGMFTLAHGKTHIVEVTLEPPAPPPSPLAQPYPSHSVVSATLMIATDDPAQPSIPVVLQAIFR
jgi:hypothetical protein